MSKAPFPSPYAKLWKKWLSTMTVTRFIHLMTLCATFGGLLIFAYLAEIRYLPTFTLADLAGLFGAAFLQGVIVVGSGVMVCLFPGWATRWVVDAMERPAAPTQEGGPTDAETKRTASPSDSVTGGTVRSPKSLTSRKQDGFRSLAEGPFILLATWLAMLAWTATFKEPIQDIFGAHYNGVLVCYALAWLASLSWLVAYGHASLTIVRHIATSVVVGAGGGLFMLLCLHDGQPYQEDAANVPAPSTGAPQAISLMFDLFGSVRQWLQQEAWWVAMLFGVSITIAAYFAIVHQRRVWERASRMLHLPSPALRFFAAKATAAVVFLSLSVTPVLLASTFAQLGLPSDEYLLFFNVLALQAVANWFVFSRRNASHALLAVVFTAAVLYLLFPMFVKRPLLLPSAVVRSLGLGGIHLHKVGIDRKHCATFVGYGVDCPLGSEGALVLSDVNLLSRIGSSTLLELQLETMRRGADIRAVSADKKVVPPTPAQTPAVTLRTEEEDLSKLEVFPCDTILEARRQRDADRDTASPGSTSSRHCLRFALASEEVLNYIDAGPRRYTSSATTAMIR